MCGDADISKAILRFFRTIFCYVRFFYMESNSLQLHHSWNEMELCCAYVSVCRRNCCWKPAGSPRCHDFSSTSGRISCLRL